MFTSSIVRTLNRLQNGPVRCPPQHPNGKRKHHDYPPNTPTGAGHGPSRTILSEPTQKRLDFAQDKVLQLKRVIAALESSTHPSDILRSKTAAQHLLQFRSWVHRLKRDLARHREYRSKYLESRETLSGRNGAAISTLSKNVVEQETVHSDQCLHCGAKASMRINTTKSTQQCVKCFREEACFDVVHTEGDRAKTSKQNHYYPASQWDNALNYAQGMRCGAVPPEIISKVVEKLDVEYQIKKEEWRNIPHTLIDKVLKKIGYKKRSKQKILCWCIIVGRQPERMTIEEYVEADKYAQVYFRCVRGVIRELNVSHRLNRKNRLSYDFLAHKIFELLAEIKDPEYKRHMMWYKLLEGDDKIWVQDLIWKKVCEQSGWKFIPTA
jgi:hypothetical protein